MSASNAEDDTVLVLGGSGFYGRYLVDDLLQYAAARVVAASRALAARRHADIIAERARFTDSADAKLWDRPGR